MKRKAEVADLIARLTALRDAEQLKLDAELVDGCIESVRGAYLDGVVDGVQEAIDAVKRWARRQP